MKTPMALSALVAAAASTATTAAVPNGKVRGMTYAPMLHSTSNMLWDDAMTTGGQVWWGDGSQNRGDLSTMSQMGVETVRLYGLAPGSDHSVFLGVAQSHNLKVFPGTSDYPLTQAPTNCLSAPDQCYSVLLASFNSLLSPQTGFTQGSGWNPQISMYNLVNEPELKFHGWQTTAKVVVTLLDALLQAEQANGITGYKPTLTIAVSTATTDAYDPNSYCLQRGFVQSGDCSVAVMCDVYEAISNPSLVGYTPVSSQADLSAALAQRFAWGFNSDLDAPATQALVVTPYTKLPFSSQALYITEYHGFPVVGLPDRMQALYAIPQISGIFFHEFETSYWKGGSEDNYGAFADGSTVVGYCVWPNCKDSQPVYCLQQTDFLGNLVGPLVAGVYGGSAPTNAWNGFCAASSLRGNLRSSILSKVNNNKDDKEDKSAAPHNN